MQKYWIERITAAGNFKDADHNPHGNPWFVFTEVNGITISIPYHSKQRAYANNEYEDFCEYLEAWNDWINLSNEGRRTYIREFRRNKNLNNTPLADKLLAQHRMMQDMFNLVTFPPVCTQAVTKSTTQENENMNTGFTNERYALERDLSKAYYAAQTNLRKKHNLDSYRPTSFDEFDTMFRAKEYDEISEKDRSRKLNDWEDATSFLTFRKAKPDEAAWKVDNSKLDEEYRAACLAIKTTADPDATRTKVTEPFRAHWVPAGHTVH